MLKILTLPLALMLAGCGTAKPEDVELQYTRSLVLARAAIDTATGYARDCRINKPIGHPCKGYALKLEAPIERLEGAYLQAQKVISAKDSSLYDIRLSALDNARLQVNFLLAGAEK